MGSNGPARAPRNRNPREVEFEPLPSSHSQPPQTSPGAAPVCRLASATCLRAVTRAPSVTQATAANLPPGGLGYACTSERTGLAGGRLVPCSSRVSITRRMLRARASPVVYPASRDAAAGSALSRVSAGRHWLTGVSLAARASQATVPRRHNSETILSRKKLYPLVCGIFRDPGVRVPAATFASQAPGRGPGASA